MNIFQIKNVFGLPDTLASLLIYCAFIASTHDTKRLKESGNRNEI